MTSNNILGEALVDLRVAALWRFAEIKWGGIRREEVRVLAMGLPDSEVVKAIERQRAPRGWFWSLFSSGRD